MTAPLTLAFHQIAASDLPRVGGKGANLGEMARAGFPVPPGFCVTTEAFRRFMAGVPGASDLYVALDALAAGDIEGVRRLGEEVRRALQEAPIPPEVTAAVATELERMGSEHAYAVRSSATAEDLPSASFAGQHDTYLNVRGDRDLIERVRACWASLFTDRAILYRAQNGFPHRSVELSVVVQRMIFPDVAGILFTADPVTGSRRTVSIDASFGLGEALVSGLVSADLYKIDKKTGAVLEARIADKLIALRPAPGGGTVRENLSDEQRKARVLGDEQARALAELGARVEAHYGSPQDIEWGIAGNEIVLLQTRPITSLYPLPEPRPNDSALHVYFSFSHAQVMTDPMSPMGSSVWRLIFPFGKSGPGYNPLLCQAGGRLYADVTPLLRNRVSRKLFPKVLRAADQLASQAIAEIAQQKELFEGPGITGAMRPQTALRWLVPIFLKAQARLLFLPPEGAAETLSAQAETFMHEFRAKLASAPPGAERLQMAANVLDDLFNRAVLGVPPYILAGVLSKAIAGRLAGQAGAADINAIARGLAGNVTTEMDLAVGDLADAARKSPDIAQHLSGPDPGEALRRAREDRGSETFVMALDAFLERYGMRGPSEIDIARPRFRDEPGSLLKAVAGNLRQSEPGTHRAHHRKLAAEAEAAARRLVESAGEGPLGVLRGAIMRRMVRVARNLLPVREHPKFLLIKTLDLIRTTLLEEASALRASGRIDADADIFYLELPEVIAALRDPSADPSADIRAVIARRKADYARFQTMSPPRVLTSDGEALSAKHAGDSLPAGAIAGSPVSAGTVEGIARVILSPDKEILQRGEILIAPFTDPGWTPLFINAAGLVMEVGGLMTHGSVVAREYGIPAVVCVPDATKRIRTGQRIRVDGDLGYVQILEPEVAAADAASNP
jgi:pyruvate,water dikinase